ncbi:MAG: hypothetical protein ABSD28_00845 [Tepidisphaeraceae bacterium]|jgi:hypothetical protein
MKKVSFSPKPAGSTARLSPDEWIGDKDARQPMKRLTIDVPLDLHKRIKSQCAIENLVMADVIRQLLEERFPPDRPKELQT